MKVELIDDLEALDGIEDDWRRLAVLRGNAFITPEWYRPWLDAEDRSRTALIVVAREESGAIAGVMPFVLDRSTRPRAIRFAGARSGDHFGIACRPEHEEEIAALAMPALEAAAGGTVVMLNRIEEEGAWPAAMAAAAGRRRVMIEQSRAEMPHISVAGLDWDGYLAGRSKKFRQRVARGLERTLQSEGTAFAVRETADRELVDADMATLFRLHDLRHEGSDSSIASERVRECLVEFARAALAQGWLRLRILELEGQAAAAYLGWHIGPRYAVYQSGFDPAWSEQSAGMLLLNDTVRSAIGEHAEEVDLLLGGEPFKWRFAPEARHMYTVALVGSARPARVLISAEAAARRYGKRAATSRRIGSLARAIARRLPSGR